MKDVRGVAVAGGGKGVGVKNFQISYMKGIRGVTRMVVVGGGG